MAPPWIGGIQHNAIHLGPVSLQELANEVHLHDFSVHVSHRRAERLRLLVHAAEDIVLLGVLEAGDVMQARGYDGNVRFHEGL